MHPNNQNAGAFPQLIAKSKKYRVSKKANSQEKDEAKAQPNAFKCDGKISAVITHTRGP